MNGPRVCSDCGQVVPYGAWIQVRCTIGNDSERPYCYNCFVQRMAKYVSAQLDLIREGRVAKFPTLDLAPTDGRWQA